MDELVRWLGVQLDEDERTARATEWCAGTRTFNGWDAARVDEVDWEIRSRNAVIGSGLGEEFTRHIAEWDPARVLREIDAKRQALDHYARIRERTKRGDEAYVLAEGAVDKQIQIMATAYDHRPGYREEWRP